MAKRPTLILLSGGLDSAAALWLAALRGPAVAVHLRVSMFPATRVLEARAAAGIARFVTRHVPHPVAFHMLANVPPRETRLAWRHWATAPDGSRAPVVARPSSDFDHVAWPTAALLAARPEIAAVGIGAVAEDFGAGATERVEKQHRAIHAALDGLRSPGSFDWVFPLGMPAPPKRAVAATMPPPLRAMAVSCIAPDRTGRPCGVCFKCLGDGKQPKARTVRPTAPIPRPRPFDWPCIELVNPDGPPSGIADWPPGTLALVPHPTVQEWRKVRAEAPVDIQLDRMWFPGLQRVVPAQGWQAARLAAGRITADLWRGRNRPRTGASDSDEGGNG